MKSMTAYGSGFAENETYQVEVEIKSVNHRFIEILFRMPKEMISFETILRQLTKNQLTRGRVEIFVHLTKNRLNKKSLTVEWHLLDQYVEMIGEANQRYQHQKIDFTNTLAGLLNNQYFMSIEDTAMVADDIEALLLTATEEALAQHILMRNKEGALLMRVIATHLADFQAALEIVKKEMPHFEAHYRQRLETKMKEVVGNLIDEPRLLTELAIFLEKADIQEEVTRLDSHIQQLMDIFQEEEPIGRKLDFLIQEMNREVNTIGSKSTVLSITNAVVTMKTELEKMREQIQNIE
ncbi:YicC/YloC family endoribonuclease [Isobaculum melis]|uniref:TIGR00255 family protein n=1 Tax=Isobaculum melis TaxID=142588 RepID=A0A1H9RAA0_9LACT|nr:YicC/YloC family endoribonuclease [Isobaculum melis]SER69475.1 TIGR00255 family protein [Isobaculum melis]